MAATTDGLAGVAAATAAADACPVAATVSTTTTTTSTLPSSCPVNVAQSASSCPVACSSDAINPLNYMPDLPNEPAVPGLGVSRVTSSIPMSPFTVLPSHQRPGADVWVYPSEQMFYNAMKRKGWSPQAEDMSTVVAIHNAVNERAWREVLAFEALHCERCPDPSLKRFMGRPKDVSPKARLLSLLGYKLPFDRHDWIVDRCGEEVRYVVDFYSATPTHPGVPAAMHIDARPALDSFQAAWDRLYMQFKWLGSGRWLQE